MILALGGSESAEEPAADRSKAWRALPNRDRSSVCSGSSPNSGTEPGIRYVTAPSDEEVNRLFNEATVFVQTSRHEGFCLPPLESMATGGAVVCTDAHGNRDFCVDGENCADRPRPGPTAAAAAIAGYCRIRSCASGSAGRRSRPPRRTHGRGGSMPGERSSTDIAKPNGDRPPSSGRPTTLARPSFPRHLAGDRIMREQFPGEFLRCTVCRAERAH